MERQLIADFEKMMGELLPKINADTYDLACEIAALPQKIRGFGHVKDKNYHEFCQHHEKLWKQISAR